MTRISSFEPLWFARLVVGAALAVIAVFLMLPLVAIFEQAFVLGWRAYAHAFSEPDARASILLTLAVALCTVPLNVLFGLAAAWVIARYDFRGKSLLTAILDLPLSMSPVIGGLIFVLLFGANGWFAPLLALLGIKVIFAFPGLVLATMFVTMPYVARSLIPLMQEQGSDEELAALGLGASLGYVWRKITLPNVRWGLLYGIILTNARAMGEFGAVSVVSGLIRGKTMTMPLYIEALYNDFDFTGAFALASLLAMLALVTLVAKALVGLQVERVRG
ncbi:MAG TPA: sulfate ABC transporter permease subunit CysW [Dongiaceae bacterium]|jgi:sulfate transport system permease protein|nr:sulfate ABC transporter permease subunit CysW [Dongiaceae bacterium]